ncbi:hypothetical protein G6F37_014091 [Rhizopus arrhizus]|nr:hypothetical protein G6F38_013974 [Rhizopus arrhizus]KAG1134099.1 hypothetical protein G6F37_014091 [Rhizopus arrhizus]
MWGEIRTIQISIELTSGLKHTIFRGAKNRSLRVQLIFHHALATEGLTAEQDYQRGIAVWMPVDAQQFSVEVRVAESLLVCPKYVW